MQAALDDAERPNKLVTAQAHNLSALNPEVPDTLVTGD